MMNNEKYDDQNLFIEENKNKRDKEDGQEKNGDAVSGPASEQIKNASASGMGALERSDENQIKTEEQVNKQTETSSY